MYGGSRGCVRYLSSNRPDASQNLIRRVQEGLGDNLPALRKFPRYGNSHTAILTNWAHTEPNTPWNAPDEIDRIESEPSNPG
jgi:hypothetical protein